MADLDKRIRDLQRELLAVKAGLATSGRAFIDTKTRTIQVQQGVLTLHFARPDFPFLIETEGFGSIRLNRYQWYITFSTSAIVMSEQDFTWTQ